MTDLLLALGKSPGARRVVRALGLPLPVPHNLRRDAGPWQERPLQDYNLMLSSGAAGELTKPLAETLAAAGANCHLASDPATLTLFRQAGEAYARPPQLLNGQAAGLRPDALLFDATGLVSLGALDALYAFFHGWIGRLRRCGRVVVLARPPARQQTAVGAAVQRGLEGFVRSVARELGRKGSTAHVITVQAGAEERLAGALRFLLSRRSAFVSGQQLELSSVVKASCEPLWLRPLDGKRALVTGAARGIGKATVQRLAAEGAQVLCLDRPGEEAALGQLARQVGGRSLACDVSALDAVEAILEALGERGIDIVVHNAGITRDKTLSRMKRQQWQAVLDVNLGAVIRITDALLAAALRDEGRLVFVSSVVGIAGNLGQSNYALSKAALLGLCAHLAPQLAERGVTANAVAPGFIETRMTAAIPFAVREGARRLSNLGQGGLPIDVAEAVTFLASPGASGITGRVLRVCGGAFVGA